MTSYDFRWSRNRHIQRYRRYPKDLALYFPWEPHTPPIGETYGTLSFYDSERIAEVKKLRATIDSDTYYREILDHILPGAESTGDQVGRILRFVQDALYYNPIQLPLYADRTAVVDPVELLELHDARCGQGVSASVALLEAAGIEARTVPANHHVVAEARWDGAWHIADALVFGADQPRFGGEWPSVAAVQKQPRAADRFPMRCFAYEPEELVREDGYRILGYVFGEWGSLPYYSYYMWGPEEYPPTRPLALPAERLGEGTVRLSWGRSIKRRGTAGGDSDRGGPDVRYRIEVGTTPDGCDVGTFETDKLTLDLDGLEKKKMYFWRIKALDVSREPELLWAPWTRSNFCLFPPSTYGWFGVI